MVAGFKSERWPTSNRNPRPASVGICSDYATSSEVVREALRDWKTKRALQLQELAALKADIDRGLTDVAEGRVQDFDAAQIIERGRKLLADRSSSD